MCDSALHNIFRTLFYSTMRSRLFQISSWALLALLVFITISPIELRPHDVMPVNFDRAAAFAVLGLLFVLAYPKQWVLVACAVVLGAGALSYFKSYLRAVMQRLCRGHRGPMLL